MTKLLLSSLAAIALLWAHAAPPVSAQEKGDRKAHDLKKVDTVPPATGKNLPEQAGTQEPSSKVPGTTKSTDIMVNGVLAVPGIPPDSETAPAKYSARIASDDALPIAAYRLRRLTGDQRREIAHQLAPRQLALTGSDEASGDVQAVVGALVPASALEALAPVPQALAAKFAELRGCGHVRSAGKLVLVDLDNMLVIGVLEI